MLEYLQKLIFPFWVSSSGPPVVRGWGHTVSGNCLL